MLKCVLGNPGMYQDKDVGILHGCAANTDEQEWPAVSSSTDVEYASKAPEVRMCVSLMALTQVTLPPEHRSDAGSNNQQGADKTGYTK